LSAKVRPEANTVKGAEEQKRANEAVFKLKSAASQILSVSPGTDVSIVGHSIGVAHAMEAAAKLEEEGISCEV
jgi:thioesterase domain-containing protein